MKLKKWPLLLLLTALLLLPSCVSSQKTGGALSNSAPETSVAPQPEADASVPQPEELPQSPKEEPLQQQPDIPKLSEASFTMTDIPPYSGEAYVTVNDNVPYFSQEDLTDQSYEIYSPLDSLGRCGAAYANIGLDLMPTQERESIGQVKPSGWHTVKYENIDGNYLYNRCHLIGYQLSGENSNEENLITGTRYLNVQGMLPFENMVADYVKETGNHVLYRVTPIFEGDNLVASGVLMEAESVEDKGEDILFCVYAYNVQPGISIDYGTGESAEAAQTSPEAEPSGNGGTPSPEAGETPQETGPSVEAEPPAEPTVDEPQEVPQSISYILNTNTKKFHLPGCSSVKQMKDSNKEFYTGSRDEVISRGYDPCKRCNP